jgi:hypothetical protein
MFGDYSLTANLHLFGCFRFAGSFYQFSLFTMFTLRIFELPKLSALLYSMYDIGFLL